MSTDRRRARHQALQILYRAEITGDAPSATLAQGGWDIRPIEPEDFDPLWDFSEPDAFCRHVLAGVEEHQEAIDAEIERLSQNWTLSRMPLVDRNILRLAAYEIMFDPEIPASVTINEAVEMAKVYGGEDSSKFVNGILGRMAEEHDAEGIEPTAVESDPETAEEE